MKVKPADPYITVKEAAERLGVARSTIYQRLAENKLRSKTIAGRIVVVRASVESYLEYLESNAA